jgi:hypothetical protein
MNDLRGILAELGEEIEEVGGVKEMSNVSAVASMAKEDDECRTDGQKHRLVS